MMLLVGVFDMLKVVFEKYLVWVNGFDALLVMEMVERRVTGRRKNDIVIEQLRYFNDQSRRIGSVLIIIFSR